MSVKFNPQVSFQGNDEKQGSYLGSAAKGLAGGAAVGALAALYKTGALKDVKDSVTIGELSTILKDEKTSGNQARTIKAGIAKVKNAVQEAAKPLKEAAQKAKKAVVESINPELRTKLKEAAKVVKEAGEKVTKEQKEALTTAQKAVKDSIKPEALTKLKESAKAIGEAGKAASTKGKEAMVNVLKEGTRPLGKYAAIGAAVGAAGMLALHAFKGKDKA